MSGAAPQRTQWAVQTLAVEASDRLLEIGCGRGVAVELVCRRLVDGRITAIDRSAAMIRLAERRNEAGVRTGLAVLRAVPLEEFDPGPERFDKIFAVNVSQFWLRCASADFDLLRRLLRPGGAVYLFYELPDAARVAQIARRLTGLLGEHGFTTSTSTTRTRRAASMVCVVGHAR